MSAPSLAAVLWDMDGTLVDTDPYWMAAETPLVESFGGVWNHEKSLALVGLGLDDAARVLQEAGVRMAVHDIVDHLTSEVMRRIAEDGVPFRPGARELLADLKASGTKTALVTMSLRRMATHVVEMIDFEAFNVVVAGDDVTRPKPYPDPYLRACELLDVEPTETVAIEDSPNGLRSAVAAGSVAIGVTSIVSLEGTGAHAVWPTLSGVTASDLSELHRVQSEKRRT
ncbi:HAD family phosphatase [Microbacterium sediminicola]|uniref:HAD family phosphatase n=1 Tax=Microbacterium sediminicola TaxID=415210 RepID=A0ABN2HUQ2_9MICO